MNNGTRMAHLYRLWGASSACALALALAVLAPATTSSAYPLESPQRQVQQVELTITIRTQFATYHTVTGLTVASTVLDLKEAFQDLEGVPPCAQILVYQGLAMANHQPLGAYGVTDGAEIDLVLRSSSC